MHDILLPRLLKYQEIVINRFDPFEQYFKFLSAHPTCGGVTLFNADTAKDIAAQKGIIDSVTKYMEKSMCTTDLTIIAKAKTEAYAEVPTAYVFIC
jgi:hypothetical protein